MERKRIAIVGSGISGLSCAWFLRNEHEIHLYEKDDRIGGHTHTVSIDEEGTEIRLDTGFMVYNEVTYPLLTKLFRQLDIGTKPTSMSFSVQHKEADIEYNGAGLNLLFGQRRNLLRPRYWRMLSQLARFNSETVVELDERRYGDMPLKDYVKARGYGEDFFRWYLSPMAAAVWSSPPEEIDGFPARTLMRFWHNHAFLGLDTHHPWRTVCNGSQSYVAKIIASPMIRIHRNQPVAGAARTEDGRQLLSFHDAPSEIYDTVILASHGDQSKRIVADPSVLEDQVLSAIRYQSNQAVVHSDPGVMPRTRRCWGSWNYRVERLPGGSPGHSTHYWMNHLQDVSKRKNYFVSINPPAEPAEIHRRISYEHPLFDSPAIAMQVKLPELLQESNRTGRYFCGAWQRYGFHEDGLWSAVNVCRDILGREPLP